MGKASRLKELAFVSSFVSIVDDRSVIVENVRKIIECNEVCAAICANGFIIRIWGSDLSLSNYDTAVIEVTGRINSIELTKERAETRRI